MSGKADDEEPKTFVVPVAEGAEAHGKTIAWSLEGEPASRRSGVHLAHDAGLRFGRMKALRVLGDGGMARVYEAFDPELEREVAVKRIHDHLASDPEARARFLREAQITALLEHPNIVPAHDLGESDGLPHLVMKRVRGRSLREVLDALREDDEATVAQWSLHRLLNAFLKVCQAIAYAHAQGVLHRDLKPANLMFGEYGEVLVLDWGVARRLTGELEGQPRDEGKIVGTPGYMSPEQVRGQGDLDARSDVWSLGAILYEILSLSPAYRAEGSIVVLREMVGRRPTPVPFRSPERDVPSELDAVCLRALEPEREHRYASASEMAAAVEAYLEGSRRREEASQWLSQAEEAWARFERLGEERNALLVEEKLHADAADAWAPLSEKQELLTTRLALAEVEPRRAKLFGEFVTLCEKALAHDPDHRGTRKLLAQAYWTRLCEAEKRRNAAAIAYNGDRVARYDDGTYAALLEGTGALTLRTSPPGAEVFCQRFDTRGLIFRLEEERHLGTTPLVSVPLAMGSYLLTLKMPGKRDVRYPVHIARGRHWDAGEEPIVMFGDDEVGEGFVYVPRGPFLCGGDADAPGSKPLREVWAEAFFIAALPVTMLAYLEFLDELHEKDPAEAWRRCPRSEAALNASGGQYFRREGGRYRLPESDPDGHRWDPSWPVFGISWHDAVTYVRWRAERDGLRYRLPFEHEREKATRGVDGRFYPWGDGFDRTLCKMGDSRREPARPEPVGVFTADVSVYGLRDAAGSIRDWCGDLGFDGDATLRPVRGGSWNYDPRFCRAACRLGRPPWRVFAYNGFRLARTAGGARETVPPRSLASPSAFTQREPEQKGPSSR